MASKVPAYKTSDGMLFEQEADAVNHELLLLVADVKSVVEVDPKGLGAWMADQQTRIGVTLGEYNRLNKPMPVASPRPAPSIPIAMDVPND
jgi:hypothetical protein